MEAALKPTASKTLKLSSSKFVSFVLDGMQMLEEFVSGSTSKDVEDPLLRAARLTQEDWCIMEWKDEHEAYVLTGG